MCRILSSHSSITEDADLGCDTMSMGVFQHFEGITFTSEHWETPTQQHSVTSQIWIKKQAGLYRIFDSQLDQHFEEMIASSSFTYQV